MCAVLLGTAVTRFVKGSPITTRRASFSWSKAVDNVVNWVGLVLRPSKTMDNMRRDLIFNLAKSSGLRSLPRHGVGNPNGVLNLDVPFFESRLMDQKEYRTGTPLRQPTILWSCCGKILGVAKRSFPRFLEPRTFRNQDSHFIELWPLAVCDFWQSCWNAHLHALREIQRTTKSSSLR